MQTMILESPPEQSTVDVASPRPSSDIAIAAHGVGKMYRIYDRPQDRLKQMLWRGRRMYGREFWALRDVWFEIKRGETIGILGRNGSGKSTLLQMIAGTLAPTEGTVQVNGRVAALLELGSGFNPEFTGRENVFMNGAILGLGREEMEQRYDAIAAFADIGDFIEQPVKMYSSGMFVRLAFAVQACVDPDIMLIDEALAVGDIFFRQKCYKRLEALRNNGTAVVLVSHSMMEIEQFCQRAVLLKHGQAIFQGTAVEATKRYMLLEQEDRATAMIQQTDTELLGQTESEWNNAAEFWPAPEAFLDISDIPQASNGWARCTGVALCDRQGQPCQIFQQGERASFFYEFELTHDIQVPISGTVIYNDKGLLVHGKSTIEYGTDAPRSLASGRRLRLRHDLALELAMGEYTFEPGLATISYADYQRRGERSYAELDSQMLRLCHLPNVSHFVIVAPRSHRPIQLLHHGVANLPGECRITVVDEVG
jgi:lipopolysaccharide transport system ATP-binding protein